MFDDDNISLYAYALFATGAALTASLYFGPGPDTREAVSTALEQAISTGEYATAETPRRTYSTSYGAASWNYPTIKWRTYEDGRVEMARTGKPGLLIIRDEKCIVCKAYRRVFHDERVERLSRDFAVMLVDQDMDPEIGAKYDVDGDYTPRTFILSPDGGLRVPSTGAHPRQRFYIDPYHPDPLAQLLDQTR